MGVIHSIKKSLLDADPTREKFLIEFLKEDIKSENTFVYLKSEVLDSELVISSGEIKLFESLSFKNKVLEVNFSQSIKPYGPKEPLTKFIVNLKNKESDIIVFPSTKDLGELFYEFLMLRKTDKKSELNKYEHKLIFSPELTRFLIRQGFRVIDTKRDRNNPENWIPVFLVDTGFYDAIKMFEREELFKKGQK